MNLMPADPTLAQLRHEMDALNARLVELLHARGRLCRAIGAWKARHGVAAADPAREAAMLAALLQETPADGYSRPQVEAILRAVFAASRARVAGVDGVVN
ncbi:MAG: chorismate mutase [Planctomycetes bacterium]|nr:chorismate mutase [Planctomycetota bacterium]